MMHNVKNSTPKKQVFRHFEMGEQLRKLHRGFPSDVSRLFGACRYNNDNDNCEISNILPLLD